MAKTANVFFSVLITLFKPIFFFLRYWANQKIVVAVAVVDAVVVIAAVVDAVVVAAAAVAHQIKTSKEEEEFFKGKSVHERAAWL